MTGRAVEVAVIGGGPAGALVSRLLAELGHEVALLERAPGWRWRACGVFSSPAGVAALRRLGVAETDLGRLARPVPAMAVQTRGGTTFRLTYGGTGALADSAVGFDRAALDPHLLAMASAAGVDVREGLAVTGLGIGGRDRPNLETSSGETIGAQVVVGADGLRSMVARSTGVSARAALGPRAALTFHVRDSGSTDARMVVIEDGYVGLAPVPADRLNVGIVLGPSWFPALRRDGAALVAERALALAGHASVTRAEHLEPLDHVAGTTPVGHAVRRRAGPRWLLVGDAAGFLDPFTGEGLHRAFVSAELAAEVSHSVLAGVPGAGLADYDRAMRERFATKDLVSRIVQGFLGWPGLFEYAARRLAARPAVRETMGLVIGDMAPASKALDPRYLAALLAP